ncbi:MAG: sialate O-acetylesterase [Verrucomicrobiales bacterium]|jgi:sialate O-acetylesterase
MSRLKTSFCFAALFAVLISSAAAELRLPNVISDHMVLQQGKPIQLWGWADAGEAVTATLGDATVSSKTGDDGKWALQLPAQKANAEPQTLTFKGANEIKLTDILIGEVWICSGQSNMEWALKSTEKGAEEIPKANHPQIRLYNVQGHINKPEAQEDAPGEWAASSPESVPEFSAVGYYFGKALQAELDVPIGLIGSNWGGTQIEPWTPKVGLEQVDSLKENAKNGGIYNGMIHPLAPFTMSGIIWYQGESNCLKGDTSIYTDRTVALVKGWRTVFKQDDLSFYFVQIAPFPYAEKFKKRNPNLTVESLPKFWDAQAACLEALPNSGMVVITDVTGNVNDIHPRNKRDVGARLARWALAKNYGQSDLVYSGPTYKSMTVDGDRAVLSFDHVGGGLAALDGEALTQFQIAGADKQFKPAEAKIEGETIVVSAEGIAKPTAVRFAWHETVIGNLGNKEGLPAVQFRTDDW